MSYALNSYLLTYLLTYTCKKRLHRSRYRLGYGLGWAQGSMHIRWGPDRPGRERGKWKGKETTGKERGTKFN